MSKNNNTNDTYMKAIHKKNKNSKDVRDVSQSKDTDDTNKEKTKTYDYERPSIKADKQHEIVNTIAGLIEINLDELEVFDTTQQINDILTEKLKLSLKDSNFLSLAKSIIRKSLLKETTAVRVSGSFLAPELYIYDGFIFNSSKGDEDYLQFFQGSFTKDFGSGSSLVQEFYDFFGDNFNQETKNFERGVFTSSLQRGIGFKEYNPIIQRVSEVWPNQTPIIIFQPILDENGNATTIFKHKDYVFNLIDSSHSELKTYLDNYHFHILPNANLLNKDEDNPNTALKEKFKNVLLPFKKKNQNQDETVFEAFDPQLQNVQTAFSLFKDINNYGFSTFGIQRPELEATKQKSVFEAELDKQEEKTLINNLTRYFESKMTKIIENFYMPIGYRVRFNFKGFEIKDRLNDAKAEQIETQNNKNKDKKGEMK